METLPFTYTNTHDTPDLSIYLSLTPTHTHTHTQDRNAKRFTCRHTHRHTIAVPIFLSLFHHGVCDCMSIRGSQREHVAAAAAAVMHLYKEEAHPSHTTVAEQEKAITYCGSGHSQTDTGLMSVKHTVLHTASWQRTPKQGSTHFSTSSHQAGMIYQHPTVFP